MNFDLSGVLDLSGMDSFLPILLLVAAICILALWLSWSIQIGFFRGSLAGLCRVGWLLPLFLAFFPQTTTEPLPRSLAFKPVQILLDDSESMRQASGGSPANLAADALIKRINEECNRLGCMPKVSRLSEQDPDTKRGYTPLANVLEAWMYKVGGDPWLLLSDGSDQNPTERWSPNLRGSGKDGRGAILGFGYNKHTNIWLKNYNIAPFSFEDKPLTMDVTVKRAQASSHTERVQVQVSAGDQALATVNAVFEAEATETTVAATIPPLPRGQHMLTVRALPTADETALWDNVGYAQVEVMPNTVGVLHLLGSPSWDGRFLRRYLKAEPKYDLISFFILRDPWDSQQVSERELSLIPFPVERLFREELPNFRVVVIQNFTLFQFLLPEYQENLVRFVKNGGGLLFVGGPRALRSSDLSSSPLREILPFEVSSEASSRAPDAGLEMLEDMLPGEVSDLSMGAVGANNQDGPGFDENQAFSVEFAKPDAAKRALANVYEDWEVLAESLTAWNTAKGLHHTERVKFKSDTTPLLLARWQSTKGVKQKERTPLAVASYPGKGRAIWLFSDSFWRLGMTVSDTASRQVYNQFMQSAMTWLMRQDLRQPLVAKNFSLRSQTTHKGYASWRVSLQGPAARYFEPSMQTLQSQDAKDANADTSGEVASSSGSTQSWHVRVCGSLVEPAKMTVSKAGVDEWELTGLLPTKLAGGTRCNLQVDGMHPAFGSVKANVTAVFPQTFQDAEMDAAPQKLEELAQLSGAALHIAAEQESIDTSFAAIAPWLERATGTDGMALPNRFKTLRDFYWLINTPWFWLMLILMPLEVIIRRWEQLIGDGRGRRLFRSKRDVEGASKPTV